MNEIQVKYWSKFYHDNKSVNYPSDFSIFVMNYFKDKSNLRVLDAGCGNGRDSYYISTKHKVTGIDKSFQNPKHTNYCKFILGDFCKINKDNFDLIYSRFSFHSITDEDQVEFINSIKKSTYLCIETRSDKVVQESLYHGSNHYRNLTNLEKLKNMLLENNFKILFIEENNNFAIYNSENPICIRVICQKI